MPPPGKGLAAAAALPDVLVGAGAVVVGVGVVSVATGAGGGAVWVEDTVPVGSGAGASVVLAVVSGAGVSFVELLGSAWAALVSELLSLSQALKLIASVQENIPIKIDFSTGFLIISVFYLSKLWRRFNICHNDGATIAENRLNRLIFGSVWV